MCVCVRARFELALMNISIRSGGEWYSSFGRNNGRGAARESMPVQGSLLDVGQQAGV